MKILLVEDDEDKREQLTDFLSNNDNNLVIIGKSYQSGMRSITNEQFDLIVLDMSMPTFDVTPTESGGRPQPFGGKEIMLQMARKGIKTNAIVVTQFDQFGQGEEMITLNELDKLLYSLLPDIYIGAVPYSITYSGWKELFIQKLNSKNLNL